MRPPELRKTSIKAPGLRALGHNAILFLPNRQFDPKKTRKNESLHKIHSPEKPDVHFMFLFGRCDGVTGDHLTGFYPT